MIDAGSVAILLVVAIGVLRRITTGEFPGSALRALRRTQEGARLVRFGDVLRSYVSVLFLDVTTTRVLRTCRTAKWYAHVLIFWGFIFLTISTTLAYFMKPEGTILPLGSPVKIFGNAGGALLILGAVAMFFVRFQQSGSPFHFTRADLFLMALLFTGLTGFGIEQAIYLFGRTGLITTSSYWIHMGLVTTLLVTAPYSKFIHALYKPSWIGYENLEKKVGSARKAELLASSH
jgi:hypothetical protein